MVGSFARALFLVHSECAESQYIASRPFRINAGPVSARSQQCGSYLAACMRSALMQSSGTCQKRLVAGLWVCTHQLQQRAGSQCMQRLIVEGVGAAAAIWLGHFTCSEEMLQPVFRLHSLKTS